MTLPYDVCRCCAAGCSSSDRCARFLDASGTRTPFTDFSDGLPRESCPMFIEQNNAPEATPGR